MGNESERVRGIVKDNELHEYDKQDKQHRFRFHYERRTDAVN